MRVLAPAWRAFVIRYCVAFVAAAVLMAGGVIAVNYVIDAKINGLKRVKVTVAQAPPQGANFLVIGSDTRAFVKNASQQQAFGSSQDSGGQRSDTMMVVHVEPDAKRTLAVSFPRDLWVNIPGVGMSKINGAYNIGPNKVIETLKANFGIEINHYIQVNFESFRGIVNAIGNVPTYFPYPARDMESSLNVANAGCVRLNGPMSLAYVRSRTLQYLSASTQRWIDADIVPDIDRIARQQDFIRHLAALAVAKSLNDPLLANDVVDQALAKLQVDQSLSKGDVLSLVDAFRTVNPNDTTALNFQTLPWQGGPDQAGQQVLYAKNPDAQGMAARLMDFTGNAAQTSTVAPRSVRLKVLDGTRRADVARAALTDFQRLGFHAIGSGTDPRGSVALTEVRYRPDARAKGALMLDHIDPAARFVQDSSLRGVDVVVVLGSDFHAITHPAKPSPAAAPSGGAGTGTSGPSGSGTATSPALTAAATQHQQELGSPAPRTPPC